VETGALIRLGMMVFRPFLVKADQDGMGFWAPPSFWEGTVGLGVLGGRGKTLALKSSQLSCYSSSNEGVETRALIRPGMTGSSMWKLTRMEWGSIRGGVCKGSAPRSPW
jgi:hypothetical protein